MAQRRIPNNPQASEMLPPELHLACALAVVQSKPPDLSVKDYVLKLREHVRRKSKPNVKAGPERHLDSASYWVQRFHQADAARAKLESKVTEYEREIERLKSELRSVQSTSTAKATTSARKRKDEALPAPAAKRRKVVHADSYASSAETVDDTLSEDLEALSAVHEEGSKLTHHLYHAHKHYKGHHTRANRQLAYHIVQAADCLAPLLTSACQRHHQRMIRAKSRPSGSTDAVPEPVLATYDNELISTFEAAARIFMSLLFGLKKLDADKPTPEDRGAVTYSFVRMFSRVLDALKENSSCQAAREAAVALATNARRQMTTRGSQKLFGRPTAAAATTTKQDSLATRLLSNFLANVLAAPSSPGEPRPLHRELVEGFLFVLFRRLGDRVFLCTFGHRKRASVAADIDAWVDPDAPDGGSPAPPPPPPAADTEKQMAQRALAIELPPLLALLERGLAVAQRHIAPPSSSSGNTAAAASSGGAAAARRQTGATRATMTAFSAPPRSSSGRPSAEALKAGLSLLARKKLERTLARAIFGGGGGGDEGDEGDGGDGASGVDEMGECLAMPVRQALTEAVGVVPPGARKKKKMSWERGGDGDGEEKDVKAWFVGEVWGLVGWEAVLEMR